MKITAVRLRKLRGTMPTPGPFWEERLVRPIDIYSEYRVRQDYEGGRKASAASLSRRISCRSRPTRASSASPARCRTPSPPSSASGCARSLLGQRPDRARDAVGPDAPPHGAWPPGRRDAGDQRDRLRAVGPQGPLARPAGLPPARRPDARPSIPAYARCSASPCRISAACASARSPSRHRATPRRNGSSAMAR